MTSVPDLLQQAFLMVRTEGIVTFADKLRQRLRRHDKPLPAYRQQSPAGPLLLPSVTDPLVSIIIPVFNKSLFTFNCLRSILETTGSIPYEVIVVDNASTDDTPAILARVGNLRVIRNEENTGFVHGCNMGAAAARARYLLFLNNDTLVTPGWLPALVRTMDARSDCGAVGGKLLYPDGVLQEAGGVIRQDSSAWIVGRFDNASKPEHNYLREVDYCSGAVLLLRKELFERIGGFDRRFAPAYWEDTDLCFAVRKAGYKVLYQPNAVVVHFEGVTAGTSVTSGMKRYQELNRDKFAKKWHAELAQQCAPGAPIFLSRDRHRGATILVSPSLSANHAVSSLLASCRGLTDNLLAFGCRVVFCSGKLPLLGYLREELQQLGVEVIEGDRGTGRYLRRYGRYCQMALIVDGDSNEVSSARRFVPCAASVAGDLALEQLRQLVGNP